MFAWGVSESAPESPEALAQGGSSFSRPKGVNEVLSLPWGDHMALAGSVAVAGVGRGGGLWDPAVASLAVSVPAGGRGAGGGARQGGAAGAQHHGPEGGAAREEAQAPAGECRGNPTAHTHTQPVMGALRAPGYVKALRCGRFPVL